MSSHKQPVPAQKGSNPKVASKEAAAHAKKATPNVPFVFGKMNYMLTAASLLILVIGFILMTGKTGDIYDFRRITLAPIVVIAGFLLGFVAIFWRDKKEVPTEE